MRSIRRILVGIKHPSLRSQPAVDKAVQLAAVNGATVELVHAITTVVDSALLAIDGVDAPRFREGHEATMRKHLEALAAGFRKRAIPVEVTCTWDYPPHEALIRRAMKTNADLVIAGRHPEKHVAPWLLSYTDWELLRLAPMPVLLVKSAAPYRAPVILAALDPTHANAKPAKTDQAVLSAATTLQRALDGTLQAVHACVSLPIVISRDWMSDPTLADRLLEKAAEDAKARFEAVLEEAGLGATEHHFVDGSPAEVIPEVARRTHSAVVVMGAVSRSGLKRLFIGNTAEKVLNQLDCDVLVVKPAGFNTPVSRLSHAEAAGGVHPDAATIRDAV